jgi:hypothetical protein
MGVFLLPISLEEEIEKMLNSFWWGAKGEYRNGIRWMSWDRLTIRKEWGGMRFRSVHGFNLATLGKQGWTFLTKPDAIPNEDFLGSSLDIIRVIFDATFGPH